MLIKKFTISIIIISISTMIFLSLYVKKTYIPIDNLKDANYSQLRISYDETNYSQFLYKKEMTYDLLKNNSDLVVEVECMDYGKQYAYSILRKCKIKKVIHGQFNNKYLYVFEPSYFLPHNDISITNGYINMKKNNNYFIFLKKVKTPKNTNKIYDNSYYPTSAMYGKYKSNCYAKTIDFNYDNEIYFDQIQNENVMLLDNKKIEQYNNILEQINTITESK